MADGVFDYAYDAEGALISKTERATGNATRFEYDHRNRLVRVTDESPGGIILKEVNYTYDVFDRRIEKTIDPDGAGSQPPQTLFTVYDGQHAWADFDGSGSLVARYLFGDRTDEIIARHTPAGGTTWYLTDRLGTVRDLVDASGHVISHVDYDSFGNILAQTNAAAGDRFKFTGREFDAETGLYYYRARFYDPSLGRFLTQDPLGFLAGDTNLYRYVANNPLAATDPSGQLALIERVAIVGATTLLGAELGFLQGWLCGVFEHWGQGSNFTEPGVWESIFEEATAGAKLGAAFGLFGGALFAMAPAMAGWPLFTVHLPLTGAFIAQTLALPGLIEALGKLEQQPNLLWGRLLCLGVNLADVVIVPKVLGMIKNAARAPSARPPAILDDLRSPAKAPGLHEADVILDPQIVQTRPWASGPFHHADVGVHGDLNTKYLWTIDGRGINIALEQTSWPTPRGNIVHTNLSPQASIGGEAWFGPGAQVTINAGSGRFGYNGGANGNHYQAAIEFWQSLGYRVNVVPFGLR